MLVILTSLMTKKTKLFEFYHITDYNTQKISTYAVLLLVNIPVFCGITPIINFSLCQCWLCFFIYHFTLFTLIIEFEGRCFVCWVFLFTLPA